jgi:hypothetical protein
MVKTGSLLNILENGDLEASRRDGAWEVRWVGGRMGICLGNGLLKSNTNARHSASFKLIRVPHTCDLGDVISK